MKNNPVEHLKQQIETINEMYNGNLIKDFIEPRYSKTFFTYQNVVRKTAERSRISAKFFNSCEQYTTLLKNRSYHFLLKDYSICRFDYKFDENNKLLSYNLLWFPCPFSKEYFREGLESGLNFFDFIDDYTNDEIIEHKDILLRSPIRIDYDCYYDGTKSDFHPTSHIHFQDSNTRAHNNGTFCLYQFFNFIIENCYPEDNYLHYGGENMVITDSMKKESSQWLRLNKLKNKKLGENIFTRYSF